MSRPINPVVTEGFIKGSCPKCKGVYSGNFSIAKQLKVVLTCDECGHLGDYFIRGDELPEVRMRHKGNRHLVGYADRKRRKKKKPNRDGVLKGQLAFDIPKDHGIFK